MLVEQIKLTCNSLSNCLFCWILSCFFFFCAIAVKIYLVKCVDLFSLFVQHYWKFHFVYTSFVSLFLFCLHFVYFTLAVYVGSIGWLLSQYLKFSMKTQGVCSPVFMYSQESTSASVDLYQSYLFYASVFVCTYVFVTSFSLFVKPSWFTVYIIVLCYFFT